ncbi:hypothetical protein LIER_41079 [Lithospermum erythrorhizon]|uniref:Uncharacterized protein n=1 Tax=Lithospermum erythrorhizon TaxID=34254 RepID=A0AAV3R605_LITER
MRRDGIYSPVGKKGEVSRENIEPQVQVHQDGDDIRVQLSRLAKTQEDQTRAIKKNRGYLRGIIKFLKCFGKDFDPVEEHHTPQHAPQPICSPGGTPVFAENFGYEPSQDKGMGFYPSGTD